MAPFDNLLFTGTAALFTLGALCVFWHLRWVWRLPGLETSLPGGEGFPLRPGLRCSVVVAARNEEARIEQTIRRLLAQRGVEVEIIVVDDRSTDRTGVILQRLAKEDPRVRALRVEVLPEVGWANATPVMSAPASPRANGFSSPTPIAGLARM